MSALTLPLSMEDYQKLFANDKEVSLKKFNIGYDFCKELKEKQIPYAVCITHPEVISCMDSKLYYMQYDKLFGKDYSICKHLFLHERKGLKRHFLVVVDEDKDVDLKVLKEELEVGKLEFCSSSELEELLHTVPGNVSLFSTKFDTLNQVNIIIDKELLDRSLLAFHSLYNGMSLFLTPDAAIKYLSTIGKQATTFTVPSKNKNHELEKVL